MKGKIDARREVKEEFRKNVKMIREEKDQDKKKKRVEGK